MAANGGTNPACAACRYQRRKCASNCLFAPYFPANQVKFQSVHRLFGVSNVIKLLGRIKDKEQRDDAVKSMIYEAEMRRRFPAQGCMAPLKCLGSLYQRMLKEYRLVLQLLASYRTPQRACTDLSSSQSQFLVNDNGLLFEISGTNKIEIGPLSFPDAPTRSSSIKLQMQGQPLLSLQEQERL